MVFVISFKVAYKTPKHGVVVTPLLIDPVNVPPMNMCVVTTPGGEPLCVMTK